ncbi:MAG: TolC family protein [Deltaproteobacteria bacterium]|nr:TolC family protein [Deltaproteobacteria bacterium]
MKSKTSLILVPLLFVSLVFQPGVALAQEKKVYTLEASIAEALENNWSLKAKKEKIDQAGNVRKQARAEFLPKLSTTYGYTRLSEVYKSDPVSLGIFGTIPGRDQNTRDNYQWKGTVTQPLFTGFALVSSYRLAELGIDQSEMEVELEKLDLVLKVKEAYFDILGVDKTLGVAKKAVESLESHVKVASSFYKVGMIPINDLLKSQVELANAQQDLVKALNATKLTRANFNTILSRQINAPVELKDILVYKPEKGDLENYMENALENRPEIKLLDINILQTDQQIRLVKSKNYPEVALTYDYIKEGDHPDVSGSPFHDANSWEVMAGVTWTFWEWGKTHYEVREKLSLKKELIQTKKALEDGIRLEIKDAMLALEEAEKNIPATRKAVEQAEENLRVSEERYKAQVTTSTEVLDAQTLLTEGRMNYYRALYDHNLARSRLQRAIGAY